MVISRGSKRHADECRKLMRNSRLFNRDLSVVSLIIPVHEGNGKTSLPMNSATNMSWDTISQKSVGKWVRHEDHHDRQADGAIHWRLTGQKLISPLIEIGFIISNKTRLQYCQNSCNTLLCIRAIQGHTGGDLMEPELMGRAAVPFNWIQFPLHRGCSFNLKPILEVGAQRRWTRNAEKGDKPCASLPLNPWKMARRDGGPHGRSATGGGEGPEPACVRAPSPGGGGTAVVPSSRRGKNLQ